MATPTFEESQQHAYGTAPSPSNSNPFRNRSPGNIAQEEHELAQDAPPAYSPRGVASSVFAPSSQLSANQSFGNEKEAAAPQSSSSSLQVPQAGPSRSPSPSSGFRFKSPTADELLNPPPPGFTRAPPFHDFMDQPFQPFSLISIDSKLDKGFPAMPPPSPAQPHPFVVHDVNEEDWTRLLSDIKAAGKLSPLNKIVANVAPGVIGIGFLPGLFVARALQSKMLRKKQGVVSNLIDHWNHYFFHPRRLEITLAQGHIIHAGTTGPPPDMPHLRSPSPAGGQRGYFHAADAYPDSDSSDSDSDSDSENGGYGRTRHEQKAMRREQRRMGRDQRRQMRGDARLDRMEWREEKRARRMDRRKRKMELREVKAEKWRLIVSFRPYTHE